MNFLKSPLLGSAAAFAAVGAAHAADLPVKKAVPIEYVRVCTAYGAGFFYIPGTETCLRLSGRARFEAGYQTPYSRQFGQRPATDAVTAGCCASTSTPAPRPATAPCAPSCASRSVPAPAARTGRHLRHPAAHRQCLPGARRRSVRPRPAVRRTPTRRSSSSPASPPVAPRRSSTSTPTTSSSSAPRPARTRPRPTCSPTPRRSATASRPRCRSKTRSSVAPRSSRRRSSRSNFDGNAAIGARTSASSPAAGHPVLQRYRCGVALQLLDVIQRNRMPDFVGVLRFDAPGVRPRSPAAVHEITRRNTIPGAGLGTAATATHGSARTPASAHANSAYGFAVQGGIKVNAPFIAPGDALYIQAGYANGAQMYSGYCAYSGCYIPECRDDPGPEIRSVHNRRSGQSVHRSARDDRELYGLRRLPALLVAGVALCLLRLLRRAELRGGGSRLGTGRGFQYHRPRTTRLVAMVSVRPAPGSTTSARRFATPTSSSPAPTSSGRRSRIWISVSKASTPRLASRTAASSTTTRIRPPTAASRRSTRVASSAPRPRTASLRSVSASSATSNSQIKAGCSPKLPGLGVPVQRDPTNPAERPGFFVFGTAV